jgi:hypothetical protein
MNNPTTNPGAPQVTSAQAWKKAASEGTPLTVPSGNTCLVRLPGMEVFVRKGLIPNSLMPIVQEAMAKGRAPQNMNVEANPKMLEEMMDLMDAVTVYCVLEPKVASTPADGQARDENILYVDEVDFNDKLFIFQVAVGGTSDLEKFREGLGEHLENLPAS